MCVLILGFMVMRRGGLRRKSRHKMAKHYRSRGKISVSRFFQQLSLGERVALVAEPAYQKGIYKTRFHGVGGEVVGMQGKCYKVRIYDGDKAKTLIVHPVHLKKL